MIKVLMIVHEEDLPNLQRTAKSFVDVKVKTLAKSGQTYTDRNGQPAYVPAGKVLIQITKIFPGGLEPFWDKAKENGFHLP